MKGLKKQRRIQVILLTCASLIAAFVVVFVFVPKEAFSLFRSPSQVLEAPPSSDEFFRIGGLVVEGSVRPDEANKFFFDVTDGGAVVPVHYVGAEPRPNLFTEGQGMVGEGYLVGGTFQASRILAKHDETYMPKEVIDALKEQGVYKPDG